MFEFPGKGEKSAILDCDNDNSITSPSAETLGVAMPIIKSAPLTPMQRDLYLGYLSNADNKAFSVGMRVNLGKTVELDLWRKAVSLVVEHDEVPRTLFCLHQQQVFQVVTDTPSHFECIDVRLLSAEKEKFEQFLLSKIRVQYDLFGSAPLWKNYLLLDANNEFHAVVATHHILSDGSGLKIFLERVCSVYEALVEQQPIDFSRFPSFYDSIPEISARFDTPEVEQYWREPLQNASPFPEERTGNNSLRKKHTLIIQGEDLQRLKACCTRLHCSLPTYFRFVYSALLSKFYAMTEDFVIYNLLDGRSSAQAKTLGCFYQILPVVLNQELFTDIASIQQFIAAMYNYRKLPGQNQYISTLMQKSLSKRESMRFYYNFYNFGYISFQGKMLDFIDYDYYAIDEVHLVVNEKPDKLEILHYYDHSSFTEAHFIERLLAISEQVINGKDRFSSLEILLPQEREHVLRLSSSLPIEYPRDTCFSQLFAAQAASTPDAIAVASEEGQISYAMLYECSLQFAQVLRRQGIGAESLVAILAERSIEFLIAIIAIFQVGGAYLPLSLSHPAKQLALILSQSGASLVLTTSDLHATLTQALSHLPGVHPRVLLLTHPPAMSEGELEDALSLPAPRSANLAYVIYTSGSTGIPKGAMIEQRGMINHLFAKITDLQLGPRDTVAQNVSQSFDISVWQFLANLLVGGRVQIISEAIAHDPLALFQQIDQYQVTVMETVPSLLQGLFSLLQSQREKAPQPGGLRWLISTGEALSPKLASRWLRTYPQIALMNGYGPTECSDDVSHFVCSSPPDEQLATVPIGRAIAHLGLYILDATLALVPQGRTGELYVSGIALGRGYLRNPQKTAERFIPDPFGLIPGARLYRTGDLARYLPDGNLEFLGRVDTQVKLRGYRIELGEIEAVLNSQEGVSQSIVLMREDQPGRPRLVAYLVKQGEKPLARAELIARLRERLPDYMLPTAFVFLDAFPLTPHGKVNSRALPAPSGEDTRTKRTLIDAAHTTARQLAEIWSQELEVEEITLQSNFFSSGGNSLSAIHILARIKEVCQVELALRDFFRLSTLAEVADQIDDILSRKEVHE